MTNVFAEQQKVRTGKLRAEVFEAKERSSLWTRGGVVVGLMAHSENFGWTCSKERPTFAHGIALNGTCSRFCHAKGKIGVGVHFATFRKNHPVHSELRKRSPSRTRTQSVYFWTSTVVVFSHFWVHSFFVKLLSRVSSGTMYFTLHFLLPPLTIWQR